MEHYIYTPTTTSYKSLLSFSKFPLPSTSLDSDMDDQDEENHQKPFPHISDEHEPPSFRHFSRQNTPPPPPPPHFEALLQGTNHLCATATTFLSPDPPSPIRVPRSPAELRWHLPPPNPLLHYCTFSLRHRNGNIHSIAVAMGLVFTGSSSPNIRAWQQTNCWEMGYIQASSGEVRAMLAQGNMLFTSHKDNKIRAWTIGSDHGSGSSSSCNCDHDEHHISFRPRKIATLPRPNPLRRFLFSRRSSQPHRDTVSCMAYNLVEGLLYTGSHDKTVKAWRLSDRKCVDTFAAHAESINDMVINGDGYLFTCSSDGTVKMWSKVCGETFHTLTTTLDFHQFPIYALALTEASVVSEGSFLYSGSSDGCIYFWKQQISGEYTHRGCIQGHHFGVLCLAAIEDIVVSGSADTTIKIWRRVMNKWKEEGSYSYNYKVYHECVGVLEGHKGPVKCIAACLDEDNFVRGFLVFSAGLDRMFKVWKVKILEETNKTFNNLVDSGGVDVDVDVDVDVNEEDYCGKYLKEIDAITPVLSPQWVERVQASPYR